MSKSEIFQLSCFSGVSLLDGESGTTSGESALSGESGDSGESPGDWAEFGGMICQVTGQQNTGANVSGP